MKNIFTIILISVVFSFAHAQETRKIKKNTDPYKETYFVLKENEEIKHGSYVRTYRSKKDRRGQFENNKRVGIWEFFNYKGEIVQKIDFTNNLILMDPSNQSFIPDSSEFSRPAILIGGDPSMLRIFKREARYPAEARRMGIEGKVFIKFEITKDGRMINEEVYRGIGYGCDEEALKVYKLIPDEWIPALDKNKAPVRSEMILPFVFKLG